MRNIDSIILSAFLAAASVPANGQTSTGPEKKDESRELKSQTNASPAQTGTADPSYKIGAQDVIKLDVWREDQLTRTVPVHPDGKITLPLLNDVQAAGLTPMELAGVIRDELKKYLTNPQVTVSVSEINSLRIYVSGEVNKSGAYQLLPHMTVLQALSGSGGFTAFARIKSIYALRTENGEPDKDSIQLQRSNRWKESGAAH